MHSSAALFVTVICVVLSSVQAHMHLSSVYINGGKQNCVRPHPTNQWDYPISDKVSQRFDKTSDMICGWPPALSQAAPSKCSIAAGTKIQMQWWHAYEGDDVVDSSHKGPCSVYMARSDTGSGKVWFKIYEEGFNTNTNQWCTDRVRQDGPNKGRVDVTIPANLAAGNYLVRGDFWALHEGYTAYGAQPYVGCLEITVTGNGNAQASANDMIDVETYFKPTDPGLYHQFLFNIYNEPNIRPQNYPIPGGRVAVIASGSTTGGSTTSASSTGSTTTTGSTTSASSTTGTSPNPNACDTGSLGCQCSDAGYCDRNLKCATALNMCLPNECATGSERCICTQGGGCDPGLSCMSNLCVKNTNAACNNGDNNNLASSASARSLSIFAFAVVVIIALL